MSAVRPTFPGPDAVDLGEAPAGAWWNDDQWRVLVSLLEAIIPPIVVEPEGGGSDAANRFGQRFISAGEFDDAFARISRATAAGTPPDRDLFRAYLADTVADNPEVLANIKRVFNNIPPQGRDELGSALQALSGRAGSLLMTGYCTPVDKQPIFVREAIIAAWGASWISKLRNLAKQLTLMTKVAWTQTSPLFKQITGYQDVHQGWTPNPGFDHAFLQFPASTPEAAAELVTLTADIVIVGSGCGGAVCAKILAEAGHDVLVVDKGYHYPASMLPMPQAQGAALLFERGGAIPTADTSLNVLAGSSWGGGGAVNWSCSLQTQDFVREQWAAAPTDDGGEGLGFFRTEKYQECMDRVCEYMGVREAKRPNAAAKVILEGSRKMGWHGAMAPQNTGGEDHWCGHCHYGCASGGKRGTTVTWLPAAAKAGARLVEGLDVEKVLFAEDGKTATGIKGTWTSRTATGGTIGPEEERVKREITVRAKRVIVSGGAIHNPILLKRSGLDNPHIGQHLYLHPVNFLAAFYKEDIRPWEGGILTSYSNSFENLDGHGHGVKLEPNVAVPSITLSSMPWRSALDYKLAAARFSHMVTFISVPRDRDAGSITPNPVDGRPVIDYTPSKFDRAHTLEGIVALARICRATGAEEIRPYYRGVEPWVRRPDDGAIVADGAGGHDGADGVRQRRAGGGDEATAQSKAERRGSAEEQDDADFEAWIGTIRAHGNDPADAAFGSAHQMGTCRMSGREADGVVDGKGRVWGRKGLYVADASVFPTASGVNPMITAMAISDWIAHGLVEDLKKGD